MRAWIRFLVAAAMVPMLWVLPASSAEVDIRTPWGDVYAGAGWGLCEWAVGADGGVCISA